MMEDTVLVKSYNIDDINYLVLNEVDYNQKHYVYLSNENDEDDIMIRRVNGDMLEPLDSEEEFINVLKIIVK